MLFPLYLLIVIVVHQKGKNAKLNTIYLDIPLENVVNSLDDIKLAIHKIEELRKNLIIACHVYHI
jgi:hypothetical protein